MEVLKGTLQDLALKVAEEQLKEQAELVSREKTIFILGSKEVGKTTIINHFLERDEKPKPTLALEYSYGRRINAAGQGIHQHQVCNIWELGSLTNSHHLIDIPIKSHGLDQLCIVIVLNLSVPDRLWCDLEGALNGIKQSIADGRRSGGGGSGGNIGSSELSSFESMELHKEKIKKIIGLEHEDINTLDIFPFPVLIVGGKYDKFQDFDPEIKKHVCRCLRSIAHTIGASLLYYSSHNASLTKSINDTINHFAFGHPVKPIRQTIFDYNEPLSIWFGQDSWKQIGVTPTNSERIGLALGAHIPQIDNNNLIDENNVTTLDPAKDSGFRESVIDELRLQKDEELLRFIKDSEIRAKFHTITT